MSVKRTTGTVIRRTKAKPNPVTADWPKGDELDALMRKWRMDMTRTIGTRPWIAEAYGPEGMRGADEGRTPLSAARKLARRLEKEKKR